MKNLLKSIQSTLFNTWKKAKRFCKTHFVYSYWWLKNIYFVYTTSRSQPHVFSGYRHYWFAKKYADKRTKISAINTTLGRKRHYVLPWGSYSLLVCDRLELQNLKKKGKINKNVNIVTVFEHAYYISK